jgi:hypothetical protein
LGALILSQNPFAGEIPHEIVQLPLLSNMNLQGSKITGAIQTSISSLQYLTELDHANNELTDFGCILFLPVNALPILAC